MKTNKKNIILLVILFCLLLVITGTSYAFLKTSFFANNTNILKVGSLSLNLDESTGNAITVEDGTPTLDSTGVNQDTYFNFKLTNNGKMSSSYTIYLEDQPLNEDDSRVDNNYVHYSLEKNNFKSSARKLGNSGSITSGIIDSKETIDYKLRLWFSTDIPQSEENKVFKAKIKIVASQNTNTLVSSLGFTDEEKKTFSKIVFQDKISEIANTTKSYDLSANKTNSIVGKIVTNEDNTNILYIQSNNQIFANPNSASLFSYFINVTEIENLSLLNTSQVTTMSAMFNNCRSLTNLDLNNFDTSNVTSMNSMFGMWNSSDDANSTSKLTTLDLGGFDTSKVTSMSSMFVSNTNLVNLNIKNFDTAKVTNMFHMFMYCKSVEGLDLRNFNTSKVTTMAGMFASCLSLLSINLSSFDTSNVTNMSLMFQNCRNLKELDITNFNTSKVTNMYAIFARCKSLVAIDLSKFDTSNVTRMDSMFSMWDEDDSYDSSGSLKKVDLSSFDTSKVTSMRSMFAFSTSLEEINLSSFDTSNVTDMYHMFNSCYSLVKLSFNKATFNKVTNHDEMFFNQPSTLNIIVKDTTAKTWLEARLKGKGTVTIG